MIYLGLVQVCRMESNIEKNVKGEEKKNSSSQTNNTGAIMVLMFDFETISDTDWMYKLPQIIMLLRINPPQHKLHSLFEQEAVWETLKSR